LRNARTLASLPLSAAPSTDVKQLEGRGICGFTNRQRRPVIMSVLGHRDPRMSVRYTHAAEETVREALNELG